MSNLRRPNTSRQRTEVIESYRRAIAHDDKLHEQFRETGIWSEARQTDAQFAAANGISRSTLYRWLTVKAAKVETSPPNLSDVNQSVRLLTLERANDWERRAAIANFSAWLVFPMSYFQRCSRTISLVSMKLAENGELQSFGEFPDDAQKALSRFLTSGLLLRISSYEEMALGQHEYYELDGTTYTERDVLTAVGSKFLDSHRQGKRTSINKVGDLLQDRKLIEGLSIKQGHFGTLWKRYSSTLPFLCAEKQVGVNWLLNIDRESSVQLEALVETDDAVRHYFHVARQCVAEFKSSLDPRAWSRIAVPELG